MFCKNSYSDVAGFMFVVKANDDANMRFPPLLGSYGSGPGQVRWKISWYVFTVLAVTGLVSTPFFSASLTHYYISNFFSLNLDLFSSSSFSISIK